MRRKIIRFLLLILILEGYLYFETNAIQTEYYTVVLEDAIPSDIRIAHISDLHNKMFRENQQPLLDAVGLEEPHIIVITGDIIDRRNFDLEPAVLLVEKLTEIAPVYYVTGNHEIWSDKADQIKAALKDTGVVILENEAVIEDINGVRVNLSGIEDSVAFNDFSVYYNTLETMVSRHPEAQVTLLLAHRPEYMRYYADAGFNVVFSGHTHGGQIRLPFVGAIIVPNQGLMPEFESGYYSDRNTQMIVSRGLGTSLIPIRVHNRPHLPIITLTSGQHY